MTIDIKDNKEAVASERPDDPLAVATSQSVCALLTCHNRSAITLECLERLQQQLLPPRTRLAVILVDDGSSDGTAELVRRQFPEVLVLPGSGDLYWNGGMHLAFSHALAAGHDYYLWLNDDTRLYPKAVSTLLELASDTPTSGKANAIVVGSLRDPLTGLTSYGGWRSVSKVNPADCTKISPGGLPLACDTFNGNCVLVPRAVANRVGNLDPRFTHAMGDMDYGFRARRAGCTAWVAPGYVGECQQNAGKGLWTDRSYPWRIRYQKMMSPKGLPPREWFVFTSRHSGPLWPVYWLVPYLKMYWSGARETFLGRGSHIGN